MASAGMPMPVSSTKMLIAPMALRVRTLIEPPSGVNLVAFCRRLTRIWWSERSSAATVMSSGMTSTVTDSAVDRILHVDRALGNPDAPGLDPRHVEDVVDDGEEVLAARADVAAVLGVFVRAQRAEDAALHHLREADDGVERRAQLVAHIGEEFGFRAVRAFGLGFLVEIALGEIRELVGLRFELL